MYAGKSFFQYSSINKTPTTLLISLQTMDKVKSEKKKKKKKISILRAKMIRGEVFHYLNFLNLHKNAVVFGFGTYCREVPRTVKTRVLTLLFSLRNAPDKQ